MNYYERLKTFLENMNTFTDEDSIPEVPLMHTPEDYKEYVIKNYIRCGAIPKSKLIQGKTYVGNCRNTNKATWLGTYFIYQREKFGTHYTEKINHFEDNCIFDVFVPLKECGDA